MPETKENKFGAAFHAHLDACAQCREHPFDLCPTGSLLLRSSVTEDVVRLDRCLACHSSGFHSTTCEMNPDGSPSKLV